jgi:type I restriction enzyme S subunit
MQEQTAIATALSDTDALIASLEKLIEKKRAIKLGAMQELLKPKEGWLVRRLGDCLIGTPNYGINAAAVAYSDILPTYIRITDISEDGRFCLENMRSVDSPFSGNYILDEGDIVFARTGASVGKTYLYNKSDGLLVFAGFLIRIKVNPKILNPFYLQNYTTTREYWNWVKVMSMRSGQPGINGNEFSQLEVPVPPSILEQNRIATILNDMDTNISTLEQKLSKYKLLKQGMMQELLTGKTRLV